MKKTIFGLVSLLLLSAVTASAQSVTSWTGRVYVPGAAAPISTTVYTPGTNVTCGVDPTTITATATNPLKEAWDDPNTLTKSCVFADPGTGPLLSVPFGNYEASLTATNSAGTSAETPRVPFSRPGLPPAVPTGYRFGK